MSGNAANNAPVNEIDIAITPELVAEHGLKPTLSRHARPCAGHPEGRSSSWGCVSHARDIVFPLELVALDCRDKPGNDAVRSARKGFRAARSWWLLAKGMVA